MIFPSAADVIWNFRKEIRMGKKDYRTYAVIGIIAAAVCLFVIKFDSLVKVGALAAEAAFPLLLGCVTAYAVNIPLKRIEKLYFPNSRRSLVTKTRRPVCIALSFAFLAAVAFLVIQIVVPELISSIQLIMEEIPPLLDTGWQWAVVQLDELPALQDYLKGANINWQDVARRTFDLLAAGAGGLFNSVITLATSLWGCCQRCGGTYFCHLSVKREREAETAGCAVFAGVCKAENQGTDLLCGQGSS